jgi:hypothetical protein
VALLVVFLAGFEDALISVLPLVSELQPDARPTMFGMGATAGAAATCAVVVLVVFGVVIREPRPVVRHVTPGESESPR